MMLCAALAAVLSVSCAGLKDLLVTGSIVVRDPDSGAKGGLVFEPGKAPKGSVRIRDPETGEITGYAGLEVDLKGSK